MRERHDDAPQPHNEAASAGPETHAPPPPGDPPRDVSNAPLPPELAEEPRSQESQWALVWREFRKRKLAVAASWIILLFVTIAIFAPFLANDRPLAYRGANRFHYAEGVRSVRVLLRQAAADELLGHRERRLELAADWLDRMAAAVPEETATELVRLRDDFRAAATRDLSNHNVAALRQRLDGLAADQVSFRSRWAFPVFASLNGLDVFFLTLNVLVLGLLISRLVATHPWRRTTRRRWGLALLVAPLAAGLLWWLLVPQRVDRTDYKRGVMTADVAEQPRAPVLYEMVIWPPIPYGLDELNLAGVFKPPGWRPESEGEAVSRWDAPHWLGTDRIGRDTLSRMIWGGRVSLSVGVVAVGIYVAIGILVGAIAGYFRGWVDMLVSRIIEVVIVFPAFFLILTIVAFVGPSLLNIMIVIGLTGWTGVARLVRGEFLRLADQEFVLAGRALGYSAPRLIFRHILPNAMAPVLVAATFGVAGAILIESALSFLGLGITVPTPSWGSILSEGREAMQIAPWLIYLPGFTIFLTIMSYNLAGEALRDASDPRLRGSR
jgi:peptide/nickel transport system permease protein